MPDERYVIDVLVINLRAADKQRKYVIFIPCCVTSDVSMKRFYFALFDDGLTLKTLKLAYRFLHSNSSYHWRW